MASKSRSRGKVDLKDNGVVKSPYLDFSGQRNNLSTPPYPAEVNIPDILRKSGAI